MSYRRLGFTPDEEQEVLVVIRGSAAETKKADEMLEILREQEKVKMFTIGATVVGVLYSLARFGDLVSDMRHKRRERAL